VKTATLPRAGRHARFTLLFETFAVRVIQAARRRGRGAVERGVSWRKEALIPDIGLGEKSFRKGMSSVTACCGLENQQRSGRGAELENPDR
jgi:hypothetical protein